MRRRVEGLDAVIADLARQTRADVPAILRLFAEEATSDVRPTWPRDSGRSADALQVVVEGGVVAIACDVPYASYIHEKGLTGPTYMVRIVEHVRRRSDELAARVSRRLAEVR